MLPGEKLNIVMLSPFFYPHNGGVERHVYYLSKELLKRKHNVTILTTLHKNTLSYNDEIDGIKIIRFELNTIPILGVLINMIKLFRHIPLVIRTNVIHCHDYQFFLWFLGLRIIFPFKKIFITYHGWEGDYPPKKHIIFLRKIAEYLTRGNICVGQFIEKWYNTKADFISHGAIEISTINNLMARQSDIVVISRFSHDVPLEKYLEAFQILKEKYHQNLKILFLGTGKLESLIRDFISKNDLNATLLGFVNNPLDYIRSTSMVVTNGYLAILEAAANQKPVFAIYQNELVKDRLTSFAYSDYFISANNNSEGFAQNIHNYIKNPHKAEFNLRISSKWAIQQTWENLAIRYLQLWEK